MKISSSPVQSHLDQLESESIYIFREVVAQCQNPVMLYSIGKDSSVLLHLALKAFHPAKLPFPLLHIDTTFKFKEMYVHRDEYVRDELGIEMRVHTNPDGLRDGVNPFDHGSSHHTHVMKTLALKQALNIGKYDAAFGGARRDEEMSRAKERIFSFRNEHHTWDPKNQRPECWNLYNGRIVAGQSIRAFPLSNWTEQDIWQYIRRENIKIPTLYYAKPRPVVRRGNTWIMVDDDRLPFEPGEKPEIRMVRFRTLGCYPLTGGIESNAATIDELIEEMSHSTTSERKDRLIDSDKPGSMEHKKREGYF